MTNYFPQETQARQHFRGISQNKAPAGCLWLIIRVLLQWSGLRSLDSHLLHSPPHAAPPRNGEGRAVDLVQGASNATVGWWEMFAGLGGLAAIRSCL